MLYFLEKSEKVATALVAPPPNLRWSPAAGDFAPRSPSYYSHSTNVLLLSADAQTSRHR